MVNIFRLGYTSLLPSPYEVHHPAGPPRYYDTMPMSGSDYPMHYHDADYNSEYGASTVASSNSRGGGPAAGAYSDKRPYDRSVDEFMWKGDRNSAAAAAQAAAAATNTYHHHLPGRGDYAQPPPSQQQPPHGAVNNNRAHGSSSGGHTGRTDHREDGRDGRNRGRERTDYRDRSRSSFNRNNRR